MAGHSNGGAYVPQSDYDRSTATDTNGTYHDATFTGLSSFAEVGGAAFGDRSVVTVTCPVSGDALALANQTAYTFPVAAVILRAWLNITTQSAGASTLDIGYTAASPTTTSDTLLDGVSGASVALFDSMNAALDSGANARAQLAAAGGYVTIDEASGDAEGLIATLYLQYVPV